MKGCVMSRQSYLKSTGVFLSVCVAVVAAACAPVRALDFNDMRNLIKNQVGESVIISVAQQDPNLAITPEQANELRGMGASESLINSIRRAPDGYSGTGTTTYSSVPYGTPIATGDYYTGTSVPQSPAPAQALPYQTTATYPTTTYVDPNAIYYDPSAPVVIQSAPTVIYETPAVIPAPTYVYPRSSSWGFSIGVGDGWGHRPRYYRDHRPYRRPPYYGGHRPRHRW